MIFTIFSVVHFSSAQTAEEVRKQISDTNLQIEELDKEIKALSGQIAVTSQQKNTLANAIKDLTLKRDQLVKQRQQTEKKISATGLVIKTLDGEINTRVLSINKTKETIANLIRKLDQQDDESILQKVLSNENISDFSVEYNNVIGVTDELKNYINDISTQKNSLAKTKDVKLDEQEQLNLLKNTLTAKESEILSNKKEKDDLLVATKNKESGYQKLLADTQKRKDAFERSIEDYEAQLKFILNPKSIPKEGSSVLSFPLSSILVTSPYGSRWGKFHYGLDLRASVGTEVKAMAAGVVEGTGDTDIACKGASFGKWVFIRYGNGLSSTYGHLSSITATVGQSVKAGDVVAYSGNTGSSTGPHLHVAVYASDGVKVDTVPSKSCNGKIFTQPISALTAYLNPASFLPKITDSMVKK